MSMMQLPPGLAPQDVRHLFVRNHTVQARIGIHDFELTAPQRLIINVDFYVLKAATTSAADAIDDVVDYDFVREEIRALVERQHFNLQETLVDAIAAAVFTKPSVLAVTVSTAKPDVYPDCEAVGVEVTLCRKAVR